MKTLLVVLIVAVVSSTNAMTILEALKAGSTNLQGLEVTQENEQLYITSEQVKALTELHEHNETTIKLGNKVDICVATPEVNFLEVMGSESKQLILVNYESIISEK